MDNSEIDIIDTYSNKDLLGQLNNYYKGHDYDNDLMQCVISRNVEALSIPYKMTSIADILIMLKREPNKLLYFICNMEYYILPKYNKYFENLARDWEHDRRATINFTCEISYNYLINDLIRKYGEKIIKDHCREYTYYISNDHYFRNIHMYSGYY